MPQFSHHTPVTQSDLANARKSARLVQKHFPIGCIGEQGNFSWGYDGKTYYVAEGVLEHLVTKACLSLDEAKQLFNALVFSASYEVHGSLIAKAVKKARKKRISGDDLMWCLIDLLSSDVAT
jgi:hypothetical protein